MKKLLLLLLLPFGSLVASESGITSAVLIEQIGKFHPLVLHFPVVLAPLSFIVALASKYIKGQQFWSQTIPYLVHATTLTSIAAAFFGLVLGATMGELDGTLLMHRNLAILFTLFMVAFSIMLLIKKADFKNETPRFALIMTGIAAHVVGAAGHYGGITTHGDLFIILQYLK